MVLFKHDKEVGLRVNLHLAWCVSCLEHLLSELLSQVLDLKDPQRVLTDGHEAFRALRGAERTGRLKRLIADWSHTMLSHVAVTEPRLV